MLSGQWFGLCFYGGMDAGGTATTGCPPKPRGSLWKHESPDFSRGENQKRWIRYYAAESLGCANREESPNEKTDQHPWSKVRNTDPQQEREDNGQNRHIGQGIQERPEETKNRIPVPDLEVLLSKNHYYIKKMMHHVLHLRTLVSLAPESSAEEIMLAGRSWCEPREDAVQFGPGDMKTDATRVALRPYGSYFASNVSDHAEGFPTQKMDP